MQRISSVILSALVLAGLSLHLAAQQDVEVIELKPGIQLKKKIVKTTTKDGEKHIVVKIMTDDEDESEGENSFQVFVDAEKGDEHGDAEVFMFSDDEDDFIFAPGHEGLDHLLENEELQGLALGVMGALQQADIQVDGKPLQIFELFSGDGNGFHKLMSADDLEFSWKGRRIHVPLKAGRKLFAAFRKHRRFGSCDKNRKACHCECNSRSGGKAKGGKHAFSGRWSRKGPGASFMMKGFPQQRREAMMKHMKKRFGGARHFTMMQNDFTKKGPGAFFLGGKAHNGKGGCEHCESGPRGAHGKPHGKAHGHHGASHGAHGAPSCHEKSGKAHHHGKSSHHGRSKAGSCDKKSCAPKKAPHHAPKHPRLHRNKTMHLGRIDTPSEIPQDVQKTVRLTVSAVDVDDDDADEDDMAERIAELEVLIQELREKIAELKHDL